MDFVHVLVSQLPTIFGDIACVLFFVGLIVAVNLMVRAKSQP